MVNLIHKYSSNFGEDLRLVVCGQQSEELILLIVVDLQACELLRGCKLPVHTWAENHKWYWWWSHSMRSPTFWCRVGASRSLLGSVEEEAAISGTCELLKTENQLFTPVNREGLLLRGEVTGFLVVCNFGWSNIFSIQASWRGRYLSHRLNKILQQQKKITFSNGRLLICKIFVCIQLLTLSTHVLIIKIIIPLQKNKNKIQRQTTHYWWNNI